MIDGCLLQAAEVVLVENKKEIEANSATEKRMICLLFLLIVNWSWFEGYLFIHSFLFCLRSSLLQLSYKYIFISLLISVYLIFAISLVLYLPISLSFAQ